MPNHATVTCSLLVIALLSAACATKRTDAPRGPSAPDSISERMEEHYTLATDLRDAVINGDLEDARDLGGRLAAYGSGTEIPPGWSPWLDELQAAAGRAAAVQTGDEAGRAAADVAGRCEGCHGALSVTPRWDEPTPVPQGDHIAMHMLRHRWAVERLWEGVISGSDELWTMGANALAEPPAFDATSPEAAEHPDIPELAARVHRIAEQPESPAEERIGLLGDLLGACSTCHLVMNWEPQ